MQAEKNPVMPNATSSEMTEWGEAANRKSRRRPPRTPLRLAPTQIKYRRIPEAPGSSVLLPS